MRISLGLVELIVGICGIQASHWSYKSQETWEIHDKSCGLQNQSPIEINIEEATPKNMPPIAFHNYDNLDTALFVNNGHTVKLSLPNSVVEPEISGGPFHSDDRYVFDNVHFHWGANDTLGSEHTINGRRYPMEIHLVHRNTKYSSKAEALTKLDGFAVVARFFETHQGDPFKPLNPIVNALSSLRDFESNTEISNLKLSDFMDDVMVNDEQIFYTYRGSMTTPPCSEIVDWLIFAEPIRVTSFQLLPFHLLLDEHGELIANNFRNLQSKMGREVYVRVE